MPLPVQIPQLDLAAEPAYRLVRSGAVEAGVGNVHLAWRTLRVDRAQCRFVAVVLSRVRRTWLGER